ncbi:MAG: 3-hydroxyacyl-ACP dehydratase FabZ family protein [Myxococcota bacterium]
MTERPEPPSGLIPHRPPFLFIDEVVHVDESRVVATRRLRPDEPQFSGHYPDFPVMPGVLLCEAVLQAGAYLVAATTTGERMASGVPVVTRLEHARFKRPARPGDVLEIEVERVESVASVEWMQGAIRIDGKLALSLRFAVTWADLGREDP